MNGNVKVILTDDGRFGGTVIAIVMLSSDPSTFLSLIKKTLSIVISSNLGVMTISVKF